MAVFSPNLLELQKLLGLYPEESSDAAVKAVHTFVERLPRTSDCAIIVRAGPLGSYTYTTEWKGWVPAFWTEQDRVVDVTGGGNAWIGGLCAGLLLTSNWRTGK